MRLLYRFLCNFLCTCMLVSSAVLVCCMDMQDRVWLSVSDNLRPRAVPWMCGASRGAHARTRAAARRPSGFIAKAACMHLAPFRLGSTTVAQAKGLGDLPIAVDTLPCALGGYGA